MQIRRPGQGISIRALKNRVEASTKIVVISDTPDSVCNSTMQANDDASVVTASTAWSESCHTLPHLLQFLRSST